MSFWGASLSFWFFITFLLAIGLTEYVLIEKDVYEKFLNLTEKVEELEREVEELKRHLWVYENPNIPSSKRINNEKKESDEKSEGKRGAPEGHIGATRQRPTPNRFVDLKPERCPKCSSTDIAITGKGTVASV